ncbi:hypothetical protein D3C86_1956860 [compost metagenome]
MLISFHVHILPGNVRNRHQLTITQRINYLFDRLPAPVIINIKMFRTDFPVIIQPFGEVVVFVFYNAANG